MVYLVTENKRKIPNLFKISPIRLDALKMFNLCECNFFRGKWSKSLGVLKLKKKSSSCMDSCV